MSPAWIEMPRFRYQAIARSGETLSGEIPAEDETAAKRSLQAQGHFPIRIQQVDAASSIPWWQRDIKLGRRDDIRLLSRFVLEFGTLLKAGLTIDRALELSAQALPAGDLARSVMAVRDAVREGMGLSEALQRDPDLFPSLMVSLARAGEVSGSLPNVMLALAAHFDRVREVREKIRSALIYPAVLSVLAFLSIIFILLAVIPEFRPLLEGADVDLPWTTSVLFAASRFLEAYWWALVLVLPICIGAGVAAWRSPSSRVRVTRGISRMRFVGPLMRSSDAARFSRAMSILTSSSVPVPSAVDVAMATQASPHEVERLRLVNTHVKGGSTLSAALERVGDYPPVLTELARVGEESGRIGDMLAHAADVLDRELARRLDSFVAYLTPVLTIVLGLIIAILIGSVFTALLSINELAV
ncbi:type II secretion system F family protein [Pyruvatibacter sp.]|uniref:type II secretion system F family protein n=1 Tax=Pyruvatibacter sp. TaxID=1981328 RepID=UPI003267C7C4